MMNFFVKRTTWYVIGFMLLSALLSFWQLSSKSFSLDEMTSIVIAKDIPTMQTILWIQEGNMWLYYFLLHFVLLFGTSEFIARGFSAVWAILTIPAFYFLAKTVKDKKLAILTLPLLLINTEYISYAQTARSYSLSLLLAVLLGYCFFKFIQTKAYPYLIGFIICAVLGVYTYVLFGLIVVVFFSIVFVPKFGVSKKLIIAGVCFVIGLLPLLVSPSLRGPQLNWLQKPPLIEFPMGFIGLAGDSIIVGVVFAFLILYVLWQKKQLFFHIKKETYVLILLILWAFFPFVFSFVFSFIVKPIFQPQYFNTSLPGFLLLCGLGLVELQRRKIMHHFVFASIIIFSSIRLIFWYSQLQVPLHHTVISNKNPFDWREAATYVSAHGKSDDVVIFYGYYIHNSFEYYMERMPYHVPSVEIASAHYDVGGGTKLPEPNEKVIDTLSQKYQRVWLVLAYNTDSWEDRRKQWEEIENMLNAHFTRSQDVIFDQIDVQLFTKR